MSVQTMWICLNSNCLNYASVNSEPLSLTGSFPLHSSKQSFFFFSLESPSPSISTHLSLISNQFRRMYSQLHFQNSIQHLLYFDEVQLYISFTPSNLISFNWNFLITWSSSYTSNPSHSSFPSSLSTAIALANPLVPNELNLCILGIFSCKLVFIFRRIKST